MTLKGVTTADTRYLCVIVELLVYCNPMTLYLMATSEGVTVNMYRRCSDLRKFDLVRGTAAIRCRRQSTKPQCKSKSSRWTIEPPPIALRAAAKGAKAAYSSTDCILFNCINVFWAKFLMWPVRHICLLGG